MLSTDIVSARTLRSRVKLEYIKKRIYSFFIFDLSIPGGNYEDIEDICFEGNPKLLYYFPNSLHTLTILRQMNLIEGFISISNILISDGKQINYIKTRKHEISFKILDNTSIVVCMVTLLPHCVRSNFGKVLSIDFPDDDLYDVINGQEEKLECTFPCLRESNINDFFTDENNKDSILSILNKFAETFTLLHGDVSSIKKETLVSILEDFVPGFIDTIDLSTLSIVTGMDGFYFAPVERQTQISIINLVEDVRDRFEEICHATILFDAHLVYSTLDSLSSKILYNYLVLYNGMATNDKLCNEPFGRFPKLDHDYEICSSFGRCNRFSRNGFLFGPSTHSGIKGSKTDLVFSPKIFLPGQTKDGYKLVAFTFKEIMAVLLLKGESKKGTESLKNGGEIDSKLSEEMSLCFKIRKYMIGREGGLKDLHPVILNQFMEVVGLSDSFRFFYINMANNAMRRSNKLLESTKTLMSSIEGDCIWGTTALTLDETSKVNEIVFKSGSDGWVICRKSLDRVFYLFFEDPKITLNRVAGKFNN